MRKVARLAEAQRRELFAEAAARLGTTPAVVEKDFWVTWVLDRLFSDPALARVLMFKGGTSLSKAYGLIERFSEDIDLVLDWRVLVGRTRWPNSPGRGRKGSTRRSTSRPSATCGTCCWGRSTRCWRGFARVTSRKASPM